MRLCYIIKEDEPHSENSTLGFPAEGLGSLSPTSGGGEGRCHLLLWWMAHRWLSSTSFPTHACQKLLGLNALVSAPYYQLFNIQEIALNKYVSNYEMCFETIWLVPKCLGDKQKFSEARGLGDLRAGDRGAWPAARLLLPRSHPEVLIFPALAG